jgi:hypothetical protein
MSVDFPPRKSAFKTGTTADLPRVPEDAVAVNVRRLDWQVAFTPQNLYHCWLIDQVAITTIRIDQENRVERRARDRVALRASTFWDDDRRLDAEVLGETLAASPARVVNQLRRTPQGCDWMIERWARLARIADLKQPWDQAQRSLAFDLLGTRPEDRDDPIGEVIDQDGQVVSTSLNHADLARREIASLQIRKQEVAGLDTLDRSLAESDYLDVPTPEIHQIRRHNAELHRRFKWYIAQVQAKPTHKHTATIAHSYYKPSSYYETKPDPEPVAAPPPGAELVTVPGETGWVQAERSQKRIPTEETDENGDLWPVVAKARREAEELKKEAREERRREKRMRLRA